MFPHPLHNALRGFATQDPLCKGEDTQNQALA